MKPCIACGKQFDASVCPGHAESTGIEDHCQACCDAGRCSAIQLENIESRTGFDLFGEPGDVFVDGYPARKDQL